MIFKFRYACQVMLIFQAYNLHVSMYVLTGCQKKCKSVQQLCTWEICHAIACLNHHMTSAGNSLFSNDGSVPIHLMQHVTKKP